MKTKTLAALVTLFSIGCSDNLPNKTSETNTPKITCDSSNDNYLKSVFPSKDDVPSKFSDLTYTFKCIYPKNPKEYYRDGHNDFGMNKDIDYGKFVCGSCDIVFKSERDSLLHFKAYLFKDKKSFDIKAQRLIEEDFDEAKELSSALHTLHDITYLSEQRRILYRIRSNNPVDTQYLTDKLLVKNKNLSIITKNF